MSEAGGRNPGAKQPVAELHLHLYGCIRPPMLLEHLSRTDPDLGWYEDAYEEAFGHRPHTAAIIERHRAGDPSALSEFESVFVFGDDDAGNFDRFQAKFNLLTAGCALRTGDEEALERELLHYLPSIRADHRARGITYAEHRLRLGATLDQPIERRFYDSMLAAFADDGSGIAERVAVSLWRSDPWAGWERTRELVLGPHGHLITGIDFCHVEEGHPPKDKAEFFAAVADFNDRHPERALAILYHVSESFRDKSLESAVRWVQEAAELGAHRLGHAIALGIDPEVYGVHDRTETVDERRDQIRYDLAAAAGLERHGVVVDRAALGAELELLDRRRGDELVTIHYDHARLTEIRGRQSHAMEMIARTGAVLEACPTSNRRIGGIDDPAHHPIHRFLAAGLPVVVASDDPGIFGIDIEHELDWAVTHAGASRQELVDNAWRCRSEVLSGRLLP